MQNTVPAARPRYRERLAPSLWLLGAAAVLAPMVALTLVPMIPTLSLLLGALAAALAIVLMIVGSPVVAVDAGMLHAGRARIDVRHLGEPVALTADEARRARGPELPGAGWHLIRGGIDGVVVVTNEDPDDPVSHWTISTRTPDRLAAAIRGAQV